jgi:hypothetical protein
LRRGNGGEPGIKLATYWQLLEGGRLVDEVSTFAIDRLQAIPGVFRVESLIAMKLVKREWPS